MCHEARYVSQNNFVFLGVKNDLAVVCSGHCHKIPRTGWLVKNRCLLLTILEAGKSQIKVPADSVSSAGLLPGSQELVISL